MAVNQFQVAGCSRRALHVLLVLCLGMFGVPAFATSCLTQAQMAPVDRVTMENAARHLMTQVQAGNVNAVQANTLPAVASDFNGIASSIQALAPMIQSATITVDALYDLDASTDQPGAQQTDFYCGSSPVVVLNFNGLPPGHYALAILHATGVQKPQQTALILAQGPDKRWLLAGFFAKPMLEAGHDGLWYWVAARRYAQGNGRWSAWFYYRIAANLLQPLNNLSSPNLTKLMHETDAAKPADLPASGPATLNANGSAFQLNAVDITTAFGVLDLDVHYHPDPMQAAQLRDPPQARKQVVAIMSALLAQHPELHAAFHGMWVHADQGNGSLFALELPMDQIAGGTPTASASPMPR